MHAGPEIGLAQLARGGADPERSRCPAERRHRAEDIRATEEAAAQAAVADTGPSPDAEIAQVHRSGRQHDHTDTAAYQRPQLGRRRGPRR